MTDATTSKVAAAALLANDELLLVNKKEEEEEEIARLEAEIKKETEATADNSKKQEILAQETEADIDFKCELCDMQEKVHYYGQTPTFAWGVSYMEDTYVLRDPFQPPAYPRHKPKPEYFIALGAKCGTCARTVCKDAACSFYYTRTFCLSCAADKMQTLPYEAQTKLSRQLAAAKK